MQTPFTLCIPGPQSSRTVMTLSFACLRCASGIANADVAKVKANAVAINFAITVLPVCPSEPVNIASASATLIWVKNVACLMRLRQTCVAAVSALPAHRNQVACGKW